MKQKLIRFMIGRYGSDQFSKFLLAIAVILMVISMFFSNQGVLYPLSLIILAYTYFRMFSRNIPKRYAENQKYMKYHNHAIQYLNKEKKIMAQRKDFHIYKCPNCKQKIRVPKGRGKIEISCKKCQHTFVKKS